MFSIEFLLKLLNRDKVSQYVYVILFASLITVFDFFSMFVFSKMIGIYLYIAIITSITFLGVLLLISIIKKQITNIEFKHEKGIFPKKEFFSITTLFFTSIFIIFPGIISSIIGLTIVLIPCLRFCVGRFLTKILKLDWNAVYEYMEIYNK